MKKYLVLPAAILLTLAVTFLFADFSAAKIQEKAMTEVIRLHVRADNNTPEEQALKLKVRNEILLYTQELLSGCNEEAQARELLLKNLENLEAVGENTVLREGKQHDISVSLKREHFDYREYDGFFLPEGEYESLIVEIGSGEGENWWCVVFPAACYMGGAETVETDPARMPSCFRLAKTKNNNVQIRWWFLDRIKSWFD